ncbi:transposase [Streptomyces sp. NPDC001222]|uniref:transposase n=1 Tax=Streptomyces sp. NPDC001222 TaxID=3364548 RepID=UPI00369F85AA
MPRSAGLRGCGAGARIRGEPRPAEQIDEIFHGSGGTHGSRKVFIELVRRGRRVSVNTVAKVMSELGLAGHEIRRHLSLTRPGSGQPPRTSCAGTSPPRNPILSGRAISLRARHHHARRGPPRRRDHATPPEACREDPWVQPARQAPGRGRHSHRSPPSRQHRLGQELVRRQPRHPCEDAQQPMTQRRLLRTGIRTMRARPRGIAEDRYRRQGRGHGPKTAAAAAPWARLRMRFLLTRLP